MKRTITTEIVGPGLLGNRARQRWRSLKRGQPLVLRRDTDNEVDPAATMVMTMDRGVIRPVGYVPSAVAGIVAPALRDGRMYSVTVLKSHCAGANPTIKLQLVKGRT
jgi:HIRAN domain-containing protein